MKFNKWTLGLAAVGVVSLASAAKAEEKTANTVLTALSSTTLSGYVDTSAQWNFGTGNANNPPYKFGGPTKADGFNLNVIQLSLVKPLDESEWAAGYHVDLWFGPDANTLGTTSLFGRSYYYGGSSDFAIRQAYVELRTPVGNGINWKIGVFDSPLGYESVASPDNPNFTRSYGHTIEPQTLTGLLASYRFSDYVSASVGIADTVGPMINDRAFLQGSRSKAESYKAYVTSLALTAPSDWGWLAGSTLYGGVVNGFSSNFGQNQTSWYVGTTVATPVTGLRVGAAWDYLDLHNSGPGNPHNDNTWAAGLYASYQATEKLSLHLRGEYAQSEIISSSTVKVWEGTATVQYDLWKNVISRVEFRWDHGDNGNYFGGTSSLATRRNAFMLAANIIYKF